MSGKTQSSLADIKLQAQLAASYPPTPAPGTPACCLPVQSFFVADGKVWVRNYQIVDKGDGSASALNRRIERAGSAAAAAGEGTGTEDPLSLVEMGPRFVLNPIRVFAGSFGGPTLYQNAAYVSPNDVRSARKRKAGFKFEDRQDAKKIIRGKKAEPAVPRGPLDDVFAG